MTKDIVRVTLDLLPADADLDDFREILQLAEELATRLERAPSSEVLKDVIIQYYSHPEVGEEAGAEQGVAILPIAFGYRISPRPALFRSSLTRIKAFVFPVLALSIASVVYGLTQLPSTHLGAGLVFGGALLMYEAIYTTFRERS